MIRLAAFALLVITVNTTASTAGEKDWPAPLASKDGIYLVLAKGMGTSREEALKDALRSAVEQVVATLVRKETITDPAQSKVIKSKILTASVGLIDGYKEQSTLEKGGVWHVQIFARVSDKKMSTQFERFKIPVKKTGIDGEGLFAEAVTEMQAERNAHQWLNHAMKDFPWNCVKAEIVEYKRLADRDRDPNVTLNFKVKYSVDLDAYEKMTRWLTDMLESLSVQKSQTFKLFGVDHERGGPDIYCSWGSAREPEPKFDATRYRCLWVVSSIKETGTKGGLKNYELDCRNFILPKKALDVFRDLSYLGHREKLWFHIRLMDKEGKLIKEISRSASSPLVVCRRENWFQPDIVEGNYLGTWRYRNIAVEMPVDQVLPISRAEIAVIRKD